MHKGNLSRRGFLERSLAGLAAAGLPLWYARQVLAHDQEQAAQEPKRIGPNDQLALGAIGIGSPKSRGTDLLRSARAHQGVRYTAVCDVDELHLFKAADLLGRDCTMDRDFRALLDRKEVDAVTIAVPDHWHALIAIHALRKGKHVYCEKPLTLTVAEGIALVKVAKETGKTFQVGSQQRSDPNFRLACELVRNGRIGKVQTVETRIGQNPQGKFKLAPIPRELDWDFWLGQAPQAEYIPERCHYEFRWWYEYSGGKVTDWGAHHNDIAQWGLGADGSGPVAVEGTCSEMAKDDRSYNVPRDFRIVYTYAGGAQVHCSSDNNLGVKFIGEDGRWVWVTRGRKGDAKAIQASDPKILEEPLPDDRPVKLTVSNDHMGNFLDGIRTGKATICPAEIGHRSVTVCHLGNIALRTGKKLKWDPVTQQFDDAEANRWLSREMRAPWKLEGA